MSDLVKPKDSQWLQLDVCREFQKGSCPRTDGSCKNAHLSNPHVEVVNGKVMACYDSCKNRCNREICKYYHPSLILIEQLLVKGRNHLAVKQNSLNVPQIPNVSQMLLPQEMSTTMIVTGNSSDVAAIKTGAGMKRSAEVLTESFYPAMFCKRPAMEAVPFSFMPNLPFQQILQFPAPAEPSSVIPLNASFVNYTDANGQLLDNLPVCQDFNRKMCTRINCKFVHLLDPKKLEIHEQRVAVCRDHANGVCHRQQCKFYHIPIQLPSAIEMASNPCGN